MDKTIIYALGSITFLYFLFALFNQKIRAIIGRKVCAICVAVSLTWLGLLVLWFLEFLVDPMVIGILMGGSVVGVMYQAENFFKKRGLEYFWLVRIIILVFGVAFVYLLLAKLWQNLFVLAFASLPLILIVWMVVFGEGKREGMKINQNTKKARLKLKELMEDCC